MKFLSIYDSNEFLRIGGLSGTAKEVFLTIEETGKGKHLYDIAVKIKKEIQSDDQRIITINIFLACADKNFEYLQENAGIALLKFLRMMNVTHHVVLISPHSALELVKQNPSNLMIVSKGVSIVGSYFEFINKSDNELKEIVVDRFDSNLKPYILSEFKLPENDRHNWANWWGIVQLMDTHRSIFPNEQLLFNDNSKNEIIYPLSLNNKLKELRSQQAIYLYGHSPSDFIRATNELLVADFEKQIRIIKDKINFIESRLTPSGSSKARHNHWADLKLYYHNLAVENLTSDNSAYFYAEERKLDDTIKQKTEELSHFKLKIIELENNIIESKNQKSSRVINVDSSENMISSIIKTRASIVSYSPKILYIDDQANEGWSEIFQVMLYGGKNETCFKTISDCSGNIDSVYDTVKQEINNFRPDLILLDLRLQKETGINLGVSELSGCQILQRIRNDYYGLPIMMTTASNKVWTFEDLMKTGADAFWIKEGIDNCLQASDSINNYYKFLWMVSKLFDDKYKMLMEFAQFVMAIDFSKGWWNEFQKELLIKEKRIQDNSDELKKLLNEAVTNIRMYLHYIHLEYGLKNSCEEISESYYASSIINKLGNVVEIIHDITEEDYKRSGKVTIDVSGMIRNRGDFEGNDIRNVRHSASHREYYLMDWNKLENLINQIIKYLKYTPKNITLLK